LLKILLAGTGKSKLIEVIKSEIFVLHAEDLKNGKMRISLCGPTGVAASRIEGYTIHKLFCMDFAYGGEAEYNPLGGDMLETLKKYLQTRPSLLIIDEISMVSNVMLMKLHARLCEIMGDSYSCKFKFYCAKYLVNSIWWNELYNVWRFSSVGSCIIIVQLYFCF